MKNYKMTVCYDGSRFYGWEHQPDIEMTIQGKLESVLKEMLGQEVEVIGCGRTDAGVHAKAYICNVHMETEMSEKEIRDYMNHYLPDDIGVNEVKVASDRFHARYNAMGKTYQYACYIGDKKPVFDRKYVTVLEGKINVEAIKKAASYLVGEHDFKSFCGNPKMKKSTVREIYSIDVTCRNDYMYLTYHGKGFLQYMVRILSGTLIEVGEGKRSPESIIDLIEAKDRSLAGPTAPARGLTLLKVHYAK